MQVTSGVHFFYVQLPFSIHFYRDNALLWPARPALWSQLYRHHKYQLKYDLLPEANCPVSWDDPTADQRHQHPMHSFRYFSNKQVEIATFCRGNQIKGMVRAQKSPLPLPLHVCFFNIWMKIVSFLVLSATRLALYKDIYKNYQRTCQAILFHL